MALTRKFLSAMGIEEDKIDQIITAHTDTVNGLKDERDRYKDDALKLPDIQKELDELKKNAVDPEKDGYKVKYEAIKEEYETYKKDVENAKTKATKESAYRELLKEAGISEKRIESVVKVAVNRGDVDSLELDADGKVKESGDLVNGIKEEWKDFIVTVSEEGADTPKPPANNGGNSFESMSLAEKMAFANDNPTNEMVKAWLEK